MNFSVRPTFFLQNHKQFCRFHQTHISKNKTGNTLLHTLCNNWQANNNSSVIKTLISQGLDVNAKNHAGQTPLDLCMQNNLRNCASALLNSGVEVDILHCQPDLHPPFLRCIQNGWVEEIDIFLNAGVDVNMRSPTGTCSSALQFAVAMRNAQILEKLIQNGANPNQQDNYGDTPLHWAINYNDPTAVGILLNAGADIEIKNNSQSMPKTMVTYNNEVKNLIADHAARMQTIKNGT